MFRFYGNMITNYVNMTQTTEIASSSIFYKNNSIVDQWGGIMFVFLSNAKVNDFIGDNYITDGMFLVSNAEAELCIRKINEVNTLRMLSSRQSENWYPKNIANAYYNYSTKTFFFQEDDSDSITKHIDLDGKLLE